MLRERERPEASTVKRKQIKTTGNEIRNAREYVMIKKKKIGLKLFGFW